MSTPNASDEPLAIWSVEDTQLELLETIWATMPGQPEDWPTWDYVRRTLRQRTPPLDAQALWDSLPSVRRPRWSGHLRADVDSTRKIRHQPSSPTSGSA